MAKQEKANPSSRIFVIDDDPNVRMMVKMILKRAGFLSVEEFSSSEQGMMKLRHGRADLVLLDWRMPGVQGIELLKAVRSWEDKVPVIMLTAQSTEDKVREAIQAGVTDYLIKPFTQDDLVEKIEKVLGTIPNQK